MKKVWIGWITGFLLFIAAYKVNTQLFPVHTILPIEFATSASAMQTEIKAIGLSDADNYHRLLRNTEIDYVFLIAYTIVILLSVRIALSALELKDNKWLYILGTIPGCFDAIENIFLLQTATQQREVISGWYVIVVRIKWALAIPFYLLAFIVAIYGLVILLRARPRRHPIAPGPGMAKDK